MGKLIKYEIKGTYKYILGVLALLLTLITGIHFYIVGNQGGSAIGASLMFLSVLVIFGAGLTTFLYIVNSFRKELYDDRGYLTFTLPLTGNQIVGGKLIVALMWFILLGIVIGAYNILMTLSFVPGEFIFSEMFTMLKNAGITYKTIIVMIMQSFISGVNTLILIYFSMALGRVTFRNKKIGGLWFVIFLILTALLSYSQIKVAQLVPYYLDINTFRIGTMDMINYGFDVNISQSGAMMTGDMGNMMINIGSFLYSIIMGVLTFLGTGYLIENKIDL